MRLVLIIFTIRNIEIEMQRISMSSLVLHMNLFMQYTMCYTYKIVYILKMNSYYYAHVILHNYTKKLPLFHLLFAYATSIYFKKFFNISLIFIFEYNYHLFLILLYFHLTQHYCLYLCLLQSFLLKNFLLLFPQVIVTIKIFYQVYYKFHYNHPLLCFTIYNLFQSSFFQLNYYVLWYYIIILPLFLLLL